MSVFHRTYRSVPSQRVPTLFETNKQQINDVTKVFSLYLPSFHSDLFSITTIWQSLCAASEWLSKKMAPSWNNQVTKIVILYLPDVKQQKATAEESHHFLKLLSSFWVCAKRCCGCFVQIDNRKNEIAEAVGPFLQKKQIADRQTKLV